eukprot:m.492650 g.492650  ORF g.492650 m.492650 type:complete len:413 (+) comp33526_c0_seq1:154-1392(+)
MLPVLSSAVLMLVAVATVSATEAQPEQAAPLATLEDCDGLKWWDQCTRTAGCHWIPDYKFCSNSTDPATIPCKHFGLQCISYLDRCSFNETFGTCSELGDDVPCSLLRHSSLCERASDRCTYSETARLCYATDTAVPCSQLTFEKDCRATTHCEYDFAARACYKKSKPLRCPAIQSKSGCLNHPGCAWREPAGLCRPEDEEPICGMHGMEECNADTACEWSTANLLCKPTGAELPCFALRSEADCTNAPGCVYDDASFHPCRSADAIVPCDRLYTRTACHAAASDCEFVDDALLCKGKHSPVPCSRYFDAGSCQAAGCEYYRRRCHTKDSYAPCDSMLTALECTRTGCDWDWAKLSCGNLEEDNGPMGAPATEDANASDATETLADVSAKQPGAASAGTADTTAEADAHTEL